MPDIFKDLPDNITPVQRDVARNIESEYYDTENDISFFATEKESFGKTCFTLHYKHNCHCNTSGYHLSDLPTLLQLHAQFVKDNLLTSNMAYEDKKKRAISLI